MASGKPAVKHAYVSVISCGQQPTSEVGKTVQPEEQLRGNAASSGLDQVQTTPKRQKQSFEQQFLTLHFLQNLRYRLFQKFPFDFLWRGHQTRHLRRSLA